MKSPGTNIATMFTGVCVATLCVCAALALMVELRAISFYSTMTARWRNTERHWVELLHIWECKNPHFVPLFRRQMGEKAGLDLGHLLIDDVTWRVCLREIPHWYGDWGITPPSVSPLCSL